MANLTSVTMDGQATHKSAWLDTQASSFDRIVVVVPNGLTGTLTFEGSTDVSTILTEQAVVPFPQYSDSSQADSASITSDVAADHSLSLSGTGATIKCSYVGTKDFVRVVWTATSGSGTIVVSCVSVDDSESVQVDAQGNVAVAQFAPNGVLTADNFDLAFRSAVEWCYSQLTASSISTANVVVPAGKWPLSGPVRFPATQTLSFDTPTPGVIGAGLEATNIVVSFHNSDPQSGAFDIADASTYSVSQRLEGFTMSTDNGSRVGCGIVVRASINTNVRDVRVRGFGEVQHYRGGWGIAFLKASFGIVHQYVNLDHVLSMYNQGGLFMSGVAQLSSRNTFLNGNYWLDCSYDNVEGVLDTGLYQGDDTAGPSSHGWHVGSAHPCIVTGFDYTTGLASGTGATLGTASFSNSIGTCTVTGLSGITSADVNRWLELTKSGEDVSGWTRLISGIYQIVEVVSSTSVKILKGTDHSSTGSLAWQVRGNSGGSILQIHGAPYHEGTKRCLVFHGPDDGSASLLSVSNVMDFNLPTAIMADRLGRLKATGIYPGSSSSLLVLRRCGSVETDALVTAIDIDDVSRPNLTCRKSSTQYDSTVTSFPFTPDRPLARGAADMAIEMGAAFVFDARRSDKLTLSTANITAATDLANGISCAPANAAKYATRVNDSVLGWTMQLTGDATAGNAGCLVATIPTNKLPQRKFYGSMIVVGRVNDQGTHRKTFVGVGNDSERWFGQTINDGGGVGYSAAYATLAGGATGYSQTLPADTRPFAAYMIGRAAAYGSTDIRTGTQTGDQSGYVDGSAGAVWGGSNALTVNIGQIPGNAITSDFVSLVLFFPDPLSNEQLRLLMSALRVEFPQLGN